MQNRRGLIFLAFALAMGVTAAWMTQQLVSESGEPEAAPITTDVVVLRADVPVATSLTKEHLQTADWPVDYVPRGALSSTADAVGRVVRRPVAAGEPVLEPTLMPEGSQAGLVSVIEDKRRAVSVKVDPVIGVAGFVTPGSRVDVLATLRSTPKQAADSMVEIVLTGLEAP